MASIKSRIVKATLKTISPLIVNADIEVQRSRQDFLGSIKKTPNGIRSRREELGRIRAEWFNPADACPSPVILYFHGGAYVSGSLLSSRVLAAELAFETGFKVLSFEYRLAPEHPYPAALEDAMDVYAHLLQTGLNPRDIVFAGESAGGGLLLCAGLLLQTQRKTLPAALVCLSPWTDLACTGRSIAANAKNDPLVSREFLTASAALYADGVPLGSPYLSPLYGDFTGFPDTLVHAGSDEILLDDAVRLCKRMRAQEVDARLKIWPDMWHVWHIFDIPEARAALREIGDFIRNKAACAV